MLTELVLASAMAIAAMASPHQHSHQHHQARQDATNFTISVNNNCHYTIHAATYSISDLFLITQESATHTIEPDCSANITTGFHQTGMRLSPNANLTIAEQYLPQAMFEYGYSSSGGMTGIAYDISMMGSVGPGMEVVPENSECETKRCTPTNCPTDQGWTDPLQSYAADVVCYHGMTDFTVTFCPDV